MKKLFLFYALPDITFISYRHFDDANTNISYSETGYYYSMKVHFSKSKTREVKEYMDHRNNNMSFVNTGTDGQLRRDDHTRFYIKNTLVFLK